MLRPMTNSLQFLLIMTQEQLELVQPKVFADQIEFNETMLALSLNDPNLDTDPIYTDYVEMQLAVLGFLHEQWTRYHEAAGEATDDEVQLSNQFDVAHKLVENVPATKDVELTAEEYTGHYETDAMGQHFLEKTLSNRDQGEGAE